MNNVKDSLESWKYDSLFYPYFLGKKKKNLLWLGFFSSSRGSLTLSLEEKKKRPGFPGSPWAARQPWPLLLLILGPSREATSASLFEFHKSNVCVQSSSKHLSFKTLSKFPPEKYHNVESCGKIIRIITDSMSIACPTPGFWFMWLSWFS